MLASRWHLSYVSYWQYVIVLPQEDFTADTSSVML